MSLFVNKKLANPILLTTSPQAFYTVPASRSTIVTVLTLSNSSSGSVDVSVNLVPSGDIPQLSNALISSARMDANQVANFNFGQILNAGDAVYASASVPNVITMHGSGIDIV